MNKHTPGPWMAYKRTEPVGYAEYEIHWSRDGECVAEVVHGEADATLIAAAPDLLSAQTMGSQVNTPDFLDWIADRLVHVYGESPNVDFVHSLRDRAKAGREAIAKATGESNG